MATRGLAFPSVTWRKPLHFRNTLWPKPLLPKYRPAPHSKQSEQGSHRVPTEPVNGLMESRQLPTLPSLAENKHHVFFGGPHLRHNAIGTVIEVVVNFIALWSQRVALLVTITSVLLQLYTSREIKSRQLGATVCAGCDQN
eukprot:3598851-Amphidinium_carterae.1